MGIRRSRRVDKCRRFPQNPTYCFLYGTAYKKNRNLRHAESQDFLIIPQTWTGFVGVNLTCLESQIGANCVCSCICELDGHRGKPEPTPFQFSRKAPCPFIARTLVPYEFSWNQFVIEANLNAIRFLHQSWPLRNPVSNLKFVD